MGTAAQTAESERRPAPRRHYCFQVRLEVKQHFYPPITVHGVSKNLSPYGMRVRVDRKVIAGARCRVEFLQAAGRIVPHIVEATVRNVSKTATSAGRIYEIGLEFDAPLDAIKRPGEI